MDVFLRFRNRLVMLVVVLTLYLLIYQVVYQLNARYDYDGALYWLTEAGTILFFAAISLLFVVFNKLAAAVFSVVGFCLAIVLIDLSEVEGNIIFQAIIFTAACQLAIGGAAQATGGGKLRDWRRKFFGKEEESPAGSVLKDALAGLILTIVVAVLLIGSVFLVAMLLIQLGLSGFALLPVLLGVALLGGLIIYLKSRTKRELDVGQGDGTGGRG